MDKNLMITISDKPHVWIEHRSTRGKVNVYWLSMWGYTNNALRMRRVRIRFEVRSSRGIEEFKAFLNGAYEVGTFHGLGTLCAYDKDGNLIGGGEDYHIKRYRYNVQTFHKCEQGKFSGLSLLRFPKGVVVM